MVATDRLGGRLVRVAVVGAVQLVRHGLVLQLVARGVRVQEEAASPADLPAAPRTDAVLLLLRRTDRRPGPLGAVATLLATGAAVLALTDQAADPGTPARSPRLPSRRTPGVLDVARLDQVGADDIVSWLALPALGTWSAHGPTAPVVARRPGRPVLTGAEREVLRLLAQGWSNAGIAARLTLSPRTVESHVSSLFGKLGLADHDPAFNRRVAATLRWFALTPDGPAR